MIEGITVKLVGDHRPFLRIGESIGYQVNIRESRYLIDCYSPLCQEIGGYGLKYVDPTTVTHCYDDHQRGFSDLELFNNTDAPDISHRISLITPEAVNEELSIASGSGLYKSPSPDSEEEYINLRMIRLRPKYRMVSEDRDSVYHLRIDGRVEIMKYGDEGRSDLVVESHREKRKVLCNKSIF